MFFHMDVHPHREASHARHWGLTLAVLPLLVAGTALAGSGYWAGPAVAEQSTVDIASPAQPTVAHFDTIRAPGSVADLDPAASIQSIAVTYPPPPPAPVAATSQSGGAPPSSTGGASSSEDFTSFCPVGANASTSSANASAMLSLVNTERARLGIGALSWSDSLASASQSWAQAMADKDDASEDELGDALAHNPNRPSGGENVGVTYSSKGRSASQAMSVVHANFMLSNGHCENLMNPAWTRMGAGVVQADNGVWYIGQNFQ